MLVACQACAPPVGAVGLWLMRSTRPGCVEATETVDRRCYCNGASLDGFLGATVRLCSRLHGCSCKFQKLLIAYQST